ncbi:MAG: radical SAM protein [Bacteroidales bacterium]|nr:radical SAM protein [Bacteroidales bacterium]
MKEFWLITRYFTARKIFNMITRSIGRLLSRILRRYINIGMPWSYSIEPCDICNLHCKECVSGLGIIRRRRGRIAMDDYRHAVDQIAPYATNLFLYFQGEPTMHPDFAEMAKYAHEKGIFTATSTNAHYLDADTCAKIAASGLDKMIVSLDGYNQETYVAYRVGGNFDTVLQGIRNLAEAKRSLGTKTPIIEVQTLVTKINEDNLPAIRQQAMDAGADLHYYKTMQIEKEEDFDIFKTTIDRYSRYDAQNRLKNPVGFCKRIIDSAVISIDMDVLPCCYDKDATMKLGNLREQSLREILRSDTAHKIISHIEYNRSHRPDICKNCGG